MPANSKLTVVADITYASAAAAYQSSFRQGKPDGRDGTATSRSSCRILRPGRSLAERLGIYEYRGQHEWTDRTPPKARSFFYTGFWS